MDICDKGDEVISMIENIIQYLKFRQQYIGIILRIVFVSMLLINTLIYFRPIRGRNKRKILKCRIRKSVEAFKNAFAVVMICFFITLAIDVVCDNFPGKYNIAGEKELQSIEGNLSKLALLEEDKWQALNNQERLEVLQCIADIEVTYLGLPHRLEVEVVDLEREYEGFYNHKDRKIVIKSTYFEECTAESCLNTILHEARHSYQANLVDLYESTDEIFRELSVFYEAQAYKEEFENYIHSEDDFIGYFCQQCETNARTYAENRSSIYWEKIDMYLEVK